MVQFALKGASMLLLLGTLSSTCLHAAGFSRRLKSEGVVLDPVRSDSTEDESSSFLTSLFLSQSSSSEVVKNLKCDLKVTNRRAYSRLSCVLAKEQDVFCFHRGRTPSVIYFRYKKNSLSKSKDIGGDPYKNIQCVTTAEEKIDCFYIDTDNLPSYASYRNGVWSDWSKFPESKEQNEIGRSSCVGIEDELSGCLYRNLNDIPKWYTISNGTVEKEKLFTHRYHSPLSCLMSENGTISCYGECNNDCLCTLTHNGTAWTDRSTIQCPDLKISSEPTTALAAGNHTHHVFSIDMSGRMLHLMHKEGTEYSPFELIEKKPLIESPECILHREDNVHCFAVGYNHALYHTHYNGTEWTHYKQIATDVLESPSCVAYSSSKILCFTRDTRGYIIQMLAEVKKGMPIDDGFLQGL